MIARVRSLLYHLLFLIWTFGLAIPILPLLLAPRSWIVAAARLWQNGTLFLLRVVVGLRWEVRGRENIPTGPALIASKHQSAWETVVFHNLLSDPAFILKKELQAIPFIGWYLTKHGMVPIDRKAGAAAMKVMLRGAQAALQRGSQVVIFPEGTRTGLDQAAPYNPGVGLLYASLDMPVVPVAVNSGLFWPRRGLVIRPGTVTIEFLPAIPPGMDRRQFIATLQDRIEAAVARLVDEAAPGLRGDSDNVDKIVDEPPGDPRPTR